MTMLMNNLFDVLNGRVPSQGITSDNWESKKKILGAALTVFNLTEELQGTEGLPSQMFCAETTLRAWRTNVLSSLSLVNEMFSEGYETVLTGRWNQDPVEVIIR